jgi:hypothetical protein
VALPFAPETPVPLLGGRFKCTRCGSTKSSARPEWGSPKMPDPTTTLIVR